MFEASYISVILLVPLVAGFGRLRKICHDPNMCVWNRKKVHTINGRPVNELQERYLYTLRNSLTGTLLATDDQFRGQGFYPEERALGLDLPYYALTMTGLMRLEVLHELLHEVWLENSLPGDFLEAGVMRGGTCIYAKGFAEAYQIQRKVWAADSFEGMPGKSHPMDNDHWKDLEFLSVPEDVVRDGFQRYQLLDDRVEFVNGWFGESLPPLRHRLRHLAILRIDVDMYLSTMQVLCNLYELLLVGGYWIADDWELKEERFAIWDFIKAHNITDRPRKIGKTGAAYFKKLGNVEVNESWCKLAYVKNMRPATSRSPVEAEQV